ncbi:MAG: hypothetical protein ACTTJJ_07985, partial [Prevotella fusca]|uniref:hypothetical protein n=1 Tax=Prevotella fusca TaxID=589436 RepID=UPI003FA12B38
GNRIKVYTPVWYDYPKSDGLTRGIKNKIINAEKANRCHVLPSSTNNLFPHPPTFVNYFHAVQS